MSNEVTLPVGADEVIAADLDGTPGRGIVVFAHGSGSSRRSPRNVQVARALQDAGFQTLLLDLLTETEERLDRQTREFRFDIGLLARRLTTGIDWLLEQGVYGPIGLFGASTGAAAALYAASARVEMVHAVVSRGGRPDLAMEVLPDVQAATLLIVGGEDPDVLRLNEQALAELNKESQIEVIADAGHLFEEPGALGQVADLAIGWFRDHLKWMG